MNSLPSTSVGHSARLTLLAVGCLAFGLAKPRAQINCSFEDGLTGGTVEYGKRSGCTETINWGPPDGGTPLAGIHTGGPIFGMDPSCVPAPYHLSQMARINDGRGSLHATRLSQTFGYSFVADDLGGGQVPAQAHTAGLAEPARHAAAHLGRKALAFSVVAQRNAHGLDRVLWLGELQNSLFGPGVPFAQAPVHARQVQSEVVEPSASVRGTGTKAGWIKHAVAVGARRDGGTQADRAEFEARRVIANLGGGVTDQVDSIPRPGLSPDRVDRRFAKSMHDPDDGSGHDAEFDPLGPR